MSRITAGGGGGDDETDKTDKPSHCPNIEDNNVVEDPLCCCEYINERGERTHIMTFCCDCETLDDSLERLIQRQPMPKERLNEVCAVFLDRLRFPWFNGARRIEPDIILPFILCPFLLLIGTYGPLWTLISLILLPVTIQILKRTFLYKIPRTKFYCSFAFSGFFYNYLVFEFILIPRFMKILHWEYSIAIVLLCLALYSFHRTRMGSREDENLVTTKLPSFYFCRTCKFYIIGRDHHCVWLNCCIGRKNRFWFLISLLFASLYLLYNVNLIMTTICYPKYLFKRFFLFPYSCPDLYTTFESSLCFMCAVYGLVITSLLIAIFCHQVRLLSRGMSYLEWKYGNKTQQSKSTSTTSNIIINKNTPPSSAS